jgi:hypothetical protein
MPNGTLWCMAAEPLLGWDATKESIVILRVAVGIESFQAEGIVCHDLKDGNILLDEEIEPVISQFDRAKFASTLELENIDVQMAMTRLLPCDSKYGIMALS